MHDVGVIGMHKLALFVTPATLSFIYLYNAKEAYIFRMNTAQEVNLIFNKLTVSTKFNQKNALDYKIVKFTKHFSRP